MVGYLRSHRSSASRSINHRWDEEKYANFKKKVSDYAQWAREAYDLQGEDDEAALTAWQKMFGTEFAADEIAEARTQVVAKKFCSTWPGRAQRAWTSRRRWRRERSSSPRSTARCNCATTRPSRPPSPVRDTTGSCVGNASSGSTAP